MSSTSQYDCVIVGAGPAGLTAATYLARYRCGLKVFDTGQSRAALIPRSHNYPGFPEGIRGTDLLQRLRQQAEQYGVEVTRAQVTRIECLSEDAFAVFAGEVRVTASKVLLATGIVDYQPTLPLLRAAIQAGHVRICPVCDGYEVLDQDVAVLGPAEKAVEKALFLRAFTDKLTVLLTANGRDIEDTQRRALEEAGIHLEAQPVVDLRVDGDEISAFLADGSQRRVEVLYPALGCEVRSSLALEAGARSDPRGYLITDAHQVTSVAGLYAVGDVANELNQICVATGHAAIASTHIYNELRKRILTTGG